MADISLGTVTNVMKQITDEIPEVGQDVKNIASQIKQPTVPKGYSGFKTKEGTVVTGPKPAKAKTTSSHESGCKKFFHVFLDVIGDICKVLAPILMAVCPEAGAILAVVGPACTAIGGLLKPGPSSTETEMGNSMNNTLGQTAKDAVNTGLNSANINEHVRSTMVKVANGAAKQNKINPNSWASTEKQISKMWSPLTQLMKQDKKKEAKEKAEDIKAEAGAKAKGGTKISGLPNGNFEMGGKQVSFSQLMLLVGITEMKARDNGLSTMMNKVEGNIHKMNELNKELGFVNSLKADMPSPTQKNPHPYMELNGSSAQQFGSAVKTMTKLGVSLPNQTSASDAKKDGYAITDKGTVLSYSAVNAMSQNLSTQLSTMSSQNQIAMMKLNQAVSQREQSVQLTSSLLQKVAQGASAAARA